MGTVSVRFEGPETERHVPDLGVTVARGGTIVVSEAFAGRGPGEWHAAAEPVEGWHCVRNTEAQPDEPSWLVQDPGSGLLAQVGTWTRSGAAEAPVGAPVVSTPAPAPAGPLAPSVAALAGVPVPVPVAVPASVVDESQEG